jgi:O-antigen/teichoic acid export membrane protein
VIARLRSNEFARHGAFVFGGVASASLFGYLFYMLLGRRLGVDAYGVVTSLASALLVVGAPAIVAQLIAARLAADIETLGDTGALRKLADLVTLYGTAVVVIVAVAGYVSRYSIAAYFKLTDTAAVVVTIIGLALFGVMTVQRGVLQGSHRFGDLSASMSIESVVRVVAGVSLAGPFGATGALTGIAVGALSALAYHQYAFQARFGSARRPVTLKRDLILRVISHVGIGQLTLTILMFYDVPLVKHMFDARSAGLYAAAALVGRAVIAAVSFVPTLIMPKATARAAAGLSPLPLLGTALALALVMVGGAVLLATLAPHLVVTLIAGKGFGDAAPLVLLYVTASGCLSLANVVAAYKMGLHRYDFVFPALGVAISEIVVLSLWHPTLLAVVGVLLTGHAAVFAVTLFRIGAGAPVRAAVVQEIVAGKPYYDS